MTTSELRAVKAPPASKTDDSREAGNGDYKGAPEAALRAAGFLRSAANPHRLMLLQQLQASSRTVMDLCKILGLRQSLVSQHLARLRSDGLVIADRRGHFVYYSLRDQRVRNLLAAVDSFFENSAKPGSLNGH
jgi:DNA-binding transcriptional ArsR family regulator